MYRGWELGLLAFGLMPLLGCFSRALCVLCAGPSESPGGPAPLRTEACQTSGIKPAIVLDNVVALFESEGNHTYQLCDLRAPAASGSLLRGDSPRNLGAGVSTTWKKPHRGQALRVFCVLRPRKLSDKSLSCAPVPQGSWELTAEGPVGPNL